MAFISSGTENYAFVIESKELSQALKNSLIFSGKYRKSTPRRFYKSSYGSFNNRRTVLCYTRFMNTRIFIDTEYAYQGMSNTSGRPNIKEVLCEILQIGAAKINMDTGEIIDTFTTLIKPKHLNPIPEFFFTLTGIDPKDLAGDTAPDFLNAIQNLKEFIGTSEPVWVFKGDWIVLSRCAKEIHNYDLPFQEFELVEPRLAAWGLTREQFEEKGLEYCSGNLGKFLEIDNTFETSNKSAHDATFDAVSMAKAVWFLEKNSA